MRAPCLQRSSSASNEVGSSFLETRAEVTSLRHSELMTTTEITPDTVLLVARRRNLRASVHLPNCGRMQARKSLHAQTTAAQADGLYIACQSCLKEHGHGYAKTFTIKVDR